MKRFRRIKCMAAAVLMLAVTACTHAAASPAEMDVATCQQTYRNAWVYNEQEGGRVHYCAKDGTDVKNIPYSNVKASDAKLVNTQKWPASGVKRIEMNYVVDRVSIFNSPTNEIILKEYHSIDKASYRATSTLKDGTLGIVQGSWPLYMWYASYTELYLPAGLAGIPVSGTWGDIDASAYEGKINLTTTSGDILARNSKLTGKLATTNGDIDVMNNSGALDLTTTTGDIETRNTPITAVHNTNGDIDIEMPALTANLLVENVNGDVEITLPRNASFRVNFSTTAHGEWDTDFPGNWTWSKPSANGSTMTGSCGSTPVYTITASTLNGSISIEDND